MNQLMIMNVFKSGCLLTLLALAVSVSGQDANQQPETAPLPTQAPSAEETKINPDEPPPIKQVEPGVFELGKVRLNQGKRSITFPANINMHEGPIEYFLVTSFGKVHESVLKMDVMPYHIHVFALMLGASGADFDALKERFSKLEENEIVPTAELNEMLKAGLFGQSLQMTIRWEKDGKDFKYEAEELLASNIDGKTMEPGQWFYTGSRVINNIFVANQSGDAVTVIGDYGSMVNYIGPGFKNDELWKANVPVLPPINHPVTVTFTFPVQKKNSSESTEKE
jgi:hypothetical protein